MPPGTRGRAKDRICYVATTFSAGAPRIMYGFKTVDLADAVGVTETDLTTQLGHLYGTNGSFSFPAGSIPVFAANAPKPPRVSKPTTLGQEGSTATTRSVSTFCAADKIILARNGGWSLVKQGRGVTVRSANSPGSQMTVWVEMPGGGRYAYRMNKSDYQANFEILGLKAAGDGENALTDERRATLFFGASAPKPGKASKLVISNERPATFSTFYAESKASELLNDGWSLTQGVPGLTVSPASPPASP